MFVTVLASSSQSACKSSSRCDVDRTTARMTWLSVPVTRSHSRTSGSSSAFRSVLNPRAFTRMIASIDSPTRAGSTTAPYPLITPLRSSARTRSATAGALSPTWPPSSRQEIRPSTCKTSRMCLSSASSCTGVSGVTSAILPSIRRQKANLLLIVAPYTPWGPDLRRFDGPGLSTLRTCRRSTPPHQKPRRAATSTPRFRRCSRPGTPTRISRRRQHPPKRCGNRTTSCPSNASASPGPAARAETQPEDISLFEQRRQIAPPTNSPRTTELTPESVTQESAWSGVDGVI